MESQENKVKNAKDLVADVIRFGSNLPGILNKEEDTDKNNSILSLLDQDDHLYGTIKSDVVGVQYYNGTVSNNEMVELVREPNNRYDRNAVRVENMESEQVGHIKKDHAKVLASIMDQALAKIEGIIPFGSNNKYRIPVHVQLWGSLDKKGLVLTLLKCHGVNLEQTQIPVKKSSSMMQGLGGSSHSSVNYGHVISSRKFVSPEEMENGLDKIFETLDEGDKATEADPVPALRTILYPHQKQALNWMICKESEKTLPPFWKMQNNVFVNTLTRLETRKKPRSIRGGILADDMGLGKTLEMISLILSNFVNGKPLACPLPGSTRECYGHMRQVLRQSAPNKKKFMKTSESKGEQPESPRFVLPSRSIVKEEKACAASAELIPLQRKSHSLVTFDSGFSETDLLSEVSDSVTIMRDDPDFKPSGLEKYTIMSDSKRSQRAKKRPAFLQGEKEEGPPVKKSAGKKSKSLLVTEPCEKIKCEGSTQTSAHTQSSTAKIISILNENFLSDMGTGSLADGKEYTCDKMNLQTTPGTIEKKEPDYSGVVVTHKKNIFSNNISTSSEEVIDTDHLPEQDCIVITDSDDELPDIVSPSKKCSKPIAADNELPEVISPSLMYKPIQVAADDELPDIVSPSIKCKPISACIPPDCDKMGRYQTSGPRGTLIVCPLSVVSNWVGQFEEHIQETVHIKLHVYHGSNRSKNVELLKDQDVVITTYSTITADFKKSDSDTENPLHKIEWLRIVLDEGHEIRNPDAKQSKAIFALKAQRRWVLTGTPIQNSMKDLWSLMNFLRVRPFTERHWWNRTIAQPIARNEEDGLKRVAHLLKNLAMRRTKNQKLNGRLLVELQAREVYLEKITMTGEEREVYDAMYKDGRITISRYFREGTLLKNYSNVLLILLRLRQICCHPRLIAKAVSDGTENNQDGNKSVTQTGNEINDDERKVLMDKLLTVLNSGSDEECAICLESLTTKAVITTCAHPFCRGCIEKHKRTKTDPLCPMCNQPLDKELIEVSPETIQETKDTETEPDAQPWASSAKIDALMKALSELRHSNPSEKCVIVSQFTSLLTLIEVPLKMQDFVFARLDGTMTARQREQAVMEFSDLRPESPTIFLLSLKAGGVGINLTAASRVFLMDPTWNPAAEEQCFDRCHRLGQTRDVIITKFVIEDSVEETMLELQDKKRNLMKKAFEKKPSAVKRRAERIQEIKNLMGL